MTDLQDRIIKRILEDENAMKIALEFIKKEKEQEAEA